MLFGIRLKENEQVVKNEVIEEFERKAKLLKEILAKNSFEIADKTLSSTTQSGEHGRGFAVVADEVRKLADNTNKAAEQVQLEMRLIMGISTDVLERQKRMLDGIETSVSLAHETVNILDVLGSNVTDNKKEVSVALNCIETQLKSSQSIQMDMNQLVEDTKQAIEGSSKNVALAQELISNLKY